MASHEFELSPPPPPGRDRELWLQHAAGFILFEDVRAYAASRLSPDLSEESREAALGAIDEALYGLMVLDGVSGALRNQQYSVSLQVVSRLMEHGPDRSTVEQLDLAEGDGMCMGFHGWKEGDFGKVPVAVRLPSK